MVRCSRPTRLLFSTPGHGDRTPSPYIFGIPLSNEQQPNEEPPNEEIEEEVEEGGNGSAQTPAQSPLDGSSNSGTVQLGVGQKTFVGLSGDDVRVSTKKFLLWGRRGQPLFATERLPISSRSPKPHQLHKPFKMLRFERRFERRLSRCNLQCWNLCKNNNNNNNNKTS